MIGTIEDELGEETGKNVYDLSSSEEVADAAPIRKLLNMVILLAIKDQASDIHLEPFEDGIQNPCAC